MDSLPLVFLSLGTMFARLLIGSVFVVAGISKLKAGHSLLLDIILGYKLVPRSMAVFLALIFPGLEVLVGGALLIGLWSQIAAMAGFVLLVVFTGAITTSLLRRIDNRCGCFDVVTPVQEKLIHRNLFLMGLLLPVYACNGGSWTVNGWANIQEVEAVDFHISIGFWLLVALWLLMFCVALLSRQFRSRKAFSIEGVNPQVR